MISRLQKFRSAKFAARRVGVGVFLALMLLTQPIWACPNCREALAESPNAYNLVQGFGWSIVFMMSMPFLIFTGVGSYFYWEVRKARALAAASAQPSPLTAPQIPSAGLPPGAHQSPTLGEIT